MRKGIITTIILMFFWFQTSLVQAQVASASDNLVAEPVTDRSIAFNISDTGVYKPIIWGLDLAWLDEVNMRRGIAFMGSGNVDIVRSSFTPTSPLVNGELQADELAELNERLRIIDLVGHNVQVMLNDDNPTVDSYFAGNAANWAKLIEVTAKHHQEHGLNVVSVAPFNEPDNTGTGQGTVQDFYNICVEIRNNSFFDSMRISGPNTLNTDAFFNWYNPLKNIIDEGNTHQLAGSFDNYAQIFQTLHTNGQHATNDELHNVMEAMVGVEYGMQTGIWWGTAEFARGEFVKASDGRRLGYAENRPNWTAASVYRNPEGKVQAFGGTSERQAVTTSYLFLVKDRNVYFDGYGPSHEYIMNLPGGTGYQNGQTNAEGVVNITWGDDIQPVIKGKYILVNRKSGLVAEVAGGSTSAGANIQQGKYTKKTYQQWNVTPVDTRIGGDFSYFKISNVNSGTCPDVMNFSLENGANIIAYNFISINQQWYLEYAEDGWFYIRNRHSSNCFEVANSLTTSGANIQQWEKDGGTNQQWRFLPVDATIEFESPSAPTSLVATAHAESIRLDWTASPETDVAGYTIFSSETASGPYNTIARNVKSTSFVDNTTTNGGTFYYVVKAVDKSLNSSTFSNEASATVTDEKALVVHLQFDGNTKDSSINLNHSGSAGNVLYAQGKVGTQAIVLNGTNTFLQLPATIANQQEITIAVWVYWNGGANWQRIFDFGNGQNEYMYLTPKLRFAIKNDSSEQKLETSALPISTWTHIALTLGSSGVRIFVNGVLATETTNIKTRPIDFKPLLNYIGRAQTSVPLFNGYIDDFIIYNYELSADEVSQVFISGVLGSDIIDSGAVSKNELSLWPIPANDFIQIKCFAKYSTDLSRILIYDIKGNLVKSNPIVNLHNTKIDVSDLTSGIYLLKITNSKETITKKIIIKHE